MTLLSFSLLLVLPVAIDSQRTPEQDSFEFSPIVKTRQCKRAVEVLQKCDFAPEYHLIPPIHRNNSRLPELAPYFQVILYVDHANERKSEFPAFCRRGFCLECLLKGSKVCAPSNVTVGTVDACLTAVTNGEIQALSEIGSLCLSKVCRWTTSQCEADEAPSRKCSRSCPCPPSATRGTHCHFTGYSIRSKLLQNGTLLEYSTARASSLDLLIYVLILVQLILLCF